MAQEKKSLEAKMLDQEITLTDTATAEDNTEADVENSTVLTHENGMAKAKLTAPLFRRRMRTIVAMCVAVVVLIAGVIGVSFIEQTEEESVDESSSISVIKRNPNDLEKITVKNKDNVLVLYSVKEKAENDEGEEVEQFVWKLQGYDETLIASSAVNAAADSVASLYATRIMEQDQTEKRLYGLDKPSITVNVESRAGDDYTLSFGNMAPDGSGYYATVTGDERIFLVSAGSVGNFNTTPEKMANTVILTAPTVEDIVKKTDKKYFDEETGQLATFDHIKLSGSGYSQSATILPIKDNEFVQYSIDLGSYSRYADPDVVKEMLGLMTDGLVAIDTYVLEPTAEEIKKYKLNSPQMNIEIKYGSMVSTVRASMYDTENNYYAVMVDELNAIYAVTADALAMLDNNIVNFYYEFVFQEFIYEFKNLKIEAGDKTYSFDITHNTSDDTFTAKSNGKPVDDALLSTYYQYFLTLKPEIADSYTATGAPTVKATFTYKGTTKGARVIELIKQSERRYLLKIDGHAMGIVNSIDVDHLIVYAEYVMTDKGIPEP